mgnify:FL=1
MVKEWDIVYPGTPLALAGTYDNKTFQVRVHVAYYIYDKSINAATVQEVKENVVRCYIEPVFATTQGDLRPVMGEQYTAVETEAMVTKEMDRKELKNYKGKK